MPEQRNAVETLHRVSGNLEPIGAFLKDQLGAPINLTGKTAKFRLVKISDASVIINDVAGTVLDAANGKVQYQPTGTDTTLMGGVASAQFAMYWKVIEAGKPDVLLPYDGARWLLVLQKETTSK
jgi:hypothetical protein